MENAGTDKRAQPTAETEIYFRDGIYGFEDIKKYVLLQEEKSGAIWSLQAAGRRYPSFIVVDPFMLVSGYKLTLGSDDLKALGSPDKSDICCMAVAVIKKNLSDSVVNLKSPIVINVKNKTGRQVIMETSEYPVRFPLFKGHRQGGEA